MLRSLGTGTLPWSGFFCGRTTKRDGVIACSGASVPEEHILRLVEQRCHCDAVRCEHEGDLALFRLRLELLNRLPDAHERQKWRDALDHDTERNEILRAGLGGFGALVRQRAREVQPRR